tara:strand:- start:1129 stop:1647 length:519 start_codon:yes stop_codon:yes gene_type:complete
MTLDRMWGRLPPGVSLRTPGALVATWFGSGLLVPGPGTWGSLATLPLGILILLYTDHWVLLAVAVLTFVVGTWQTQRLIDAFPDDAPKDNSSIVVDETVGQLIALIPAAASPLLWLAAFVLFRLFDIWKPGPVRFLERRLKGVWGIMMDDVVAGIMAAVCVYGLALLELTDV